MDQNEIVAVLIIESSGCLMGAAMDVDTATTLIALLSEDPANWEEASSVWNRYQTPAVCEFISILPIEAIERDTAMKTLAAAAAWVAIDFPNKRLFTGGQMLEIDRDVVFAMDVDEAGDQHCPVSIHLPPWWELHKGATVDAVNQPRLSAIKKPHVDRDFLYGDPLLQDVATRSLAVVDSDEWKAGETSEQNQNRYAFTVQIHREWLMTPREELAGCMPRQLLHGAIGWNDLVTEGQRLRFSDGGPMIAAPDNWSGFSTAPMGSQEMCIYFDLCRELIDASLIWCQSEEGKQARVDTEQASIRLVEFLRKAKDDWLNNSFEGDSPPCFIIECDRRRVPIGVGVAIEGIEGIDGAQSEQHIIDCDCPICQMMAEGKFGVAFSGIDGHHLELDDEFAFSMKETHEEWELQQREFGCFHAELDDKQAEREADGEADDPFASAWTGIQSDGPLPGDRRGYLKMAFMMAEIVNELQVFNAPREEITAINESFANYRRSDDFDRSEQALLFKANLQSIAERFPYLVAKSADLQSRIDEAERNLGIDGTDPELPF